LDTILVAEPRATYAGRAGLASRWNTELLMGVNESKL
jgi:hypothetical protein